MNPTALAVAGYIAWTLALMALIEIQRSRIVLATGRAPNTFAPDGSDVSPFMHRLCRAHANCYESFPLIGGTLLLALATDATALTDGLALWLLAARVGQSLVHLVSNATAVVQLRFAFFAAQLAIVGVLLVRLASRYVG